MKKMLFSSMLVGALALPSLAFAAPDTPKPTPPHADHAQSEAASPAGARHHAEGPHSHTLRMAERLAAIETAIGIKTDQLDSWRAYTAALVNLMPEPPRERPEAGEAPKDQILGERMADRMIEQAEKAKAFKEAAKNLREKLTPEQLSRLNSLSQEMRAEHKGEPKPPHAGPDGGHKPAHNGAHGAKHHANPNHVKPAPRH